MDKKELAIALHDKNYNCAQAVACAFAEEVGVDKEVLFKACEGFGLGMGGMQGTCGAVTGAVMLAGFLNSDGNLEAPASKTSTYELTKMIVQKFEGRNKASRCRDLKGAYTGVRMRSCPDCIRDAVEIAQEILKI